MNTCTITGNAGRDAELKYTQSGMAVCNFSVAEYKGENKDSVWWSIVCFGETAETVAPLVKVDLLLLLLLQLKLCRVNLPRML